MVNESAVVVFDDDRVVANADVMLPVRVGRGLHRGLRRSALRPNSRGLGTPGPGAVDAGDGPTVLRSFTVGHVRQLDRVLGIALERAWAAGAGPGDGRLVIDADSFVTEVFGPKRQGVGFGYTRCVAITPVGHAGRHW